MKLLHPARWGWWALGLMALWLSVRSAEATAESVPEYEVKAALLYNFAVFTEWPSERLSAATPSFDVCILGEDPFGPAVDRLTRQLIHEKPIVVRRLASSGSLGGCHLLFISESEGRRLDPVLEQARVHNVLTIAEGKGMAERGATVGLLLEKGRIVFEVNRQAALSAGLTISSKVLSLARKVY